MPDAQVGQGVAVPQGTVQPAPQPAPAVVPAASAAAPVAAQPAADNSAGEPLPQGMAPGKDGRIQVLSTSAFKRLKTEAREKGKKEALSEFAKQAGFTNVDDLQKALTGLKNPAPAAAETKPQNAPTDNKWEREKGVMQRQVEDLNRRLKTESDNRKELQRQIDAKEAEMELREKALLVGIRDPEYAIRLITRDLEGKSDDELSKFDETKFFEGLREKHPYLFGETVKPATTGTGAGAPAAPKPGDASVASAQNGKVDATKMKPDEFREFLRRKGLGISI